MCRPIIYDNVPPTSWEESMMIGCGRMGASIMAGVAQEILFLNEETIWSQDRNMSPDPSIKDNIAKVRELMLEGKPASANALAGKLLSRSYREICSYEGAGKLNIELHESDSASGYGHRLDLINGVATVFYNHRGSLYTREYFASYPDNVIACRITSSNAPISAYISYERERTLSCHAESGELIALAKTTFGDHKFCVKAKVVTDGRVECENGQISVSGTKELCVYINIGTEFRYGEDFMARTSFPDELDYEKLKARHIADFSSLMSRADIELPAIPETAELPISDHFRIRTIPGPKDESLFETCWQFGRYLLVSSSRHGTLPANLQGLWTKCDFNPWSSDYHTNINLQANYWPAEITNLSECHLSLFDYMNDYLLESGKKTAELCYGTRGCVVHHLSDIYGFTLPADGPWGLWPHGASWLSLHLWEHYRFTNDIDFLKNTAYKFIEESALFFIDNLRKDVRGRLVYAPSTSPENKYFAEEDGKRSLCYLTASSTMDTQIIATLFDIYTDASEHLGIESETVEAAKKLRSELPPMQIGKHGQLQEWIEDYDEFEQGHRHISHAFGLYPASLITRSTPELFKAIEVSINRRLAVPGKAMNDIGWSTTWKAAMFARLRRGDRSFGMLNNYISGAINKSFRNITDIPPLGGPVFQVDATFAYTAALSEMLIQSHEETISLLPAIPSRWDHGSFRGLCARGGFEVDAVWSDGCVRSFTVRSDSARSCFIELPAKQGDARFTDENGNVYTAKDSVISLPSFENITLTLT